MLILRGFAPTVFFCDLWTVLAPLSHSTFNSLLLRLAAWFQSSRQPAWLSAPAHSSSWFHGSVTLHARQLHRLDTQASQSASGRATQALPVTTVTDKSNSTFATHEQQADSRNTNDDVYEDKHLQKPTMRASRRSNIAQWRQLRKAYTLSDPNFEKWKKSIKMVSAPGRNQVDERRRQRIFDVPKSKNTSIIKIYWNEIRTTSFFVWNLEETSRKWKKPNWFLPLLPVESLWNRRNQPGFGLRKGLTSQIVAW